MLPFPELATTPPVLHMQCTCSGALKQTLMAPLHFSQLLLLLCIQQCTGKLEGIVGPRRLSSCVILYAKNGHLASSTSSMAVCCACLIARPHNMCWQLLASILCSGMPGLPGLCLVSSVSILGLCWQEILLVHIQLRRLSIGHLQAHDMVSIFAIVSDRDQPKETHSQHPAPSTLPHLPSAMQFGPLPKAGSLRPLTHSCPDTQFGQLPPNLPTIAPCSEEDKSRRLPAGSLCPHSQLRHLSQSHL